MVPLVQAYDTSLEHFRDSNAFVDARPHGRKNYGGFLPCAARIDFMKSISDAGRTKPMLTLFEKPYCVANIVPLFAR